MTSAFQSWSLRSALALAVFIGAWAAIHHGRLARGQIIDTPVYESYGNAMANGELPYRDFSLEYPPGALPVFVIPALGNEGDSDAFRRRFEVLMWVCGGVLLLALSAALGFLRAPPRRGVLALGAVALTPLLLGTVILTRFDLYPAALVACALAALLGGRLLLGHGLLGVAFAVKLWPGVLLPLALAYVWRARGPRAALRCGAVFAVVVGAIVLPFVVVSPGGVWDSVVRQTTRPLQIESLGAALVIASHHVFGTSLEMVSSHGSQNLGGGAANAIGALQTVLQIAAVVAVWIWFARRPWVSRWELVRACALAGVAFVALGKVLSPQFLIWLVPLVPLVAGRGLVPLALFAAAEVVTQLWFPRHYWEYALQFDRRESFLVLGRDLLLVGLLGSLAGRERTTWDEEPIARDNPVAVAVVVRRGDKYLVLHRAHEGATYAGDWAWGPPAGARHPGEDVDACAERELREEIGVELPVARTDAGDEACVVYTADAPPGLDIVLSPEHDDYRWVTLDDALELCRPARVAAQLRGVALLDRHAHELDAARTT